jgi:hypothetical protein
MLPPAMARGTDGRMSRTTTPESAQLTELIVLLHQRGMTWKQIAARLKHDFGIRISSAAVWQRYTRWERQHNGTHP